MSVDGTLGLRVPVFLRTRKGGMLLFICVLLTITAYYHRKPTVVGDLAECDINSNGGVEIEISHEKHAAKLEEMRVEINADKEQLKKDTQQLESLTLELENLRHQLDAERAVLDSEREALQGNLESVSGVGTVEIDREDMYITSADDPSGTSVNKSASEWQTLFVELGACGFDDLARLRDEHWDGDALKFTPPDCKLMIFKDKEVVVSLLKNKHISMVGDSIARQIYFFLVYTVWKALGKRFNADLGGCRWGDADFYDDKYNIRLTYQKQHYGERACVLANTLWRPSLPDHVWWNSGLHHQAQKTDATTEYTQALEDIHCVQETMAESPDSARKPVLWFAETTSTHNGGQKGNLLNAVTDKMNAAMATTLSSSGVYGRMVHLRNLTKGPQLHLKDQVHFTNAPLMGMASLFLHHILLHDGLTADAVFLKDGETEASYVERLLFDATANTNDETETEADGEDVKYGYTALEMSMDGFVSCDPGPEWRTETSRKKVLEKENDKKGITKNERRLIHEEGIESIRAVHHAATMAQFEENGALSDATCCAANR